MKSMYVALLSTLLFGSMGVTQAAPIFFTGSTYTTFALADAGAASNGPDSQLSVGILPISSTANAASNSGDTASAFAFADELFLTTTSEANGASGPASSVASASFTGVFNALPGLLNLSLAFDVFIDQLANGFASNQLAVTLEVGGVSLLNTILFDTTLINQQFLLASVGVGLFDLTLIGISDAAPSDYAFSLASVNATLDAVAVPEPASAALLLAGLLGMGYTLRHKPRQQPA